MAGRIIGAFVAIAVGAVALGAVVNKDDTPVAEAEPVAQQQVRVVRVIDGDTIVVNNGGTDETVRLLNVDTPETKDPDVRVECLGPEATTFLERRLKPGAVVNLDYDIERTDKYGRTLAAVYESGALVNADIARAGFGVAVTFEPNHRFYPPVRQAQEEAERTRLGLFSPTVECTVPAQVGQAKNALAAARAEDPTGVEELTEGIEQLETALREAEDVRLYLTDDSHFVEPVLAAAYTKESRRDQAQTLLSVISEAETTKKQLKKQLKSARAASAKLTPTVVETTADEEVTSGPTTESTRVKVTQKTRGAQPAGTTKPAKHAPEPVKTKKPAPQPTKVKTTSKPKDAGNPYPGYNGPRCYAPGGKTWKPC